MGLDIRRLDSGLGVNLAAAALPVLGFLACSGPQTPGGVDKLDAALVAFVDGAPAAIDAAPIADARSTAGLHGQTPAVPKPAPEFTAENYDGSPRMRDALLGHPTVLWFFPFAGTPG
jgi:hypothetical protein